MLCVAFSYGHLLHSAMLFSFPLSFHGLIAHFSLALNDGSLCGCTGVYISAHLLKDIVVVSKFWQLRVQVLCERKFLTYLDKYQRACLLDLMVRIYTVL